MANPLVGAMLVVSPAHAGIDPVDESRLHLALRFPRPRGDRPRGHPQFDAGGVFPPPTRG